jgi:hypothetical protein
MPRKQAINVIPNLLQAIECLTVEDLKKLIQLFQSGHKLNRKAELVNGIASQVQDNLEKIWRQLDQLQKAAVAEVVHSDDNNYRDESFVAKYGQQPNWGTGDRYSRQRQPSLLCLFFYSKVMPADLKQALFAFVPKPQATRLNEVGDRLLDTFQMQVGRMNYRTSEKVFEEFEFPLTIVEMERLAPKDLAAVLRLIQSGKVAVSDKTALPSAATVKAIATVLQGGDFYDDDQRQATKQGRGSLENIGGIKSYAWTALLQVGGLAELSNKKLILTKAGLKALQDPSAKTLQTLWKRWSKTTTFDEFRRIDVVKGQTGKGARGMTAVAGRREVIASALGECSVGQWVLFSEFSKYMVASSQVFEVTRDPYNLYIEEQGYGNLGYEGYHDWHILQERYIRCLLLEYVATLGMIDVAYTEPALIPADYSDLWGTDDFDFLSRYDGLIYFRLTSLGAYCLGLSDKYVPPAIANMPTLRVLPSLEIVADGDAIDAADLLVLNLYTVRVSELVWRLDMQKLLAALEDGHQLSGLREVLELRSSEPLPESVREFLDDVAERADGLQDLGEARLIQCVSSHLASLIANDPLTKRFCQPIGGRGLVVMAIHEGKFHNALRLLGYVLPPMK